MLKVLLVLVNSVLAEAERFYGDLPVRGLTALPGYLTVNASTTNICVVNFVAHMF
jgi:hypothetical protein